MNTGKRGTDIDNGFAATLLNGWGKEARNQCWTCDIALYRLCEGNWIKVKH